jgi:hypothetical protein
MAKDSAISLHCLSKVVQGAKLSPSITFFSLTYPNNLKKNIQNRSINCDELETWESDDDMFMPISFKTLVQLVC